MTLADHIRSYGARRAGELVSTKSKQIGSPSSVRCWGCCKLRFPPPSSVLVLMTQPETTTHIHTKYTKHTYIQYVCSDWLYRGKKLQCCFHSLLPSSCQSGGLHSRLRGKKACSCCGLCEFVRVGRKWREGGRQRMREPERLFVQEGTEGGREKTEQAEPLLWTCLRVHGSVPVAHFVFTSRSDNKP